MRSRAYAFAVIALTAGPFLAVAAANLILDPEAVFGTGVFDTARNPNTRYQQLVTYRAAPARYDGILFGSSRAYAVPREELSRHLQGVTFGSFAVDAGTLADHLPALQYVVRDKAARHEPLRAVFLLLDLDSLGFRPKANKFIQTLLPPQLTGERASAFWWRNLTAIQPKTWRSSVRAALNPSETGVTADLLADAGIGAGSPGDRRSGGPPLALPRINITDNMYFEVHVRLLQQFVDLCREQHLALTVAISPMNPRQLVFFDQKSIEAAVDRLTQIVPLWDFSGPNPALENPQRWRDSGHFSAEVAHVMIERIFGEATPAEWSRFGQLRDRTGAVVSSR